VFPNLVYPHPQPLSHLKEALSYEEREIEVSFYWRGEFFFALMQFKKNIG
jgi:hypothetical protein